jgi:flagellar biosynthesis/type III secretory pathway chaperone
VSGFERIAVLLTLIERLCEVVAQESECVRRMAVDRIAELHKEKRALAQAYEKELAALRGEPEVLGSLPIETRRELEEGMRRLRAATRRNVDLLLAAKTVTERLLRSVSEALAEEPAAATAPPGRAGRVIAVSFDRSV